MFLLKKVKFLPFLPFYIFAFSAFEKTFRPTVGFFFFLNSKQKKGLFSESYAAFFRVKYPFYCSGQTYDKTFLRQNIFK